MSTAVPRDVPVPKDFVAALKKDAKAKAAFNALPTSRQKEILRYLGSLKTAGSLEKNIDRVLKHLKGEKADKLHAIMRTEKS